MDAPVRIWGIAALIALVTGCSASPQAPATSSPPTSASSAPSSSAATTSPAPTASSATPISSPTVTPSAAPTAASVVRLTIRLAGCEGCRIVAANAGTQAAPRERVWNRSATISSGRAVLSVPLRQTRGMTFGLACPDGCSTSNAQPVAALLYAGRAPGARVGAGAAASARSASACWAGTSAGTATLSLRLVEFADPSQPGTGRSVRLWADPGVAVVPGTAMDTWKGALGTQDVVLC
jgi:cytoskeletal protein RodZ